MTFVIVYTVLFPVVLNTVLGVRSVPTTCTRAALSLGASRARVSVGGRAARRAAEHHHRPAQRPRLRLARADRRRDHRRHQRHRLHDVRRAPRRLRRGDPARHDRARHPLVHRRRLDPGADRARHRPALGTGEQHDEEPDPPQLVEDLLRPLRRQRTSLPCSDVSLDVQPGEFVSVVGPSGCGKTTILNMVAGFIPPYRRRDPASRPAGQGPGPERGVVFQSFALFPWKTVLENVGFGPKMRGVPQGRARRDRPRIPRARRPRRTPRSAIPNELSGGMQQRVGVVRALANKPDVLLMDEPFASVDAQTRMTLQEELTRIWQERRPTMLFITHDVARPCSWPIASSCCRRAACSTRWRSTCPARALGHADRRRRLQGPVGRGAAAGALRMSILRAIASLPRAASCWRVLVA